MTVRGFKRQLQVSGSPISGPFVDYNVKFKFPTYDRLKDKYSVLLFFLSQKSRNQDHSGSCLTHSGWVQYRLDERGLRCLNFQSE